MKQLRILLFFLITAPAAFAQTKEGISFEQIKTQCASMSLDKRARVSVTRFNVTTRTDDQTVQQNANANNRLKALSTIFGGGAPAQRADAIPPILGDNLAARLTDALQSISCFRVLETLANNKDLTNEIDASDSKYSSKKAPKAGRQLGPQIVATGEVTEYSMQSKGVNIAGVGAGKKIVKMGFILKLINAETRDVIFSRQIRAQSKASGNVSVLGLVSTANSDPAIAAVVDDGILQAVGLMVHVRDSLNITVDNVPGNQTKDPKGEREVEISLVGANFTSFNAVAAIIAHLPGYKSMEKGLSSGTGNYTVSHTGDADSFLAALSDKLGTKYEVTGYTNDKIELKVK
ncbi:hypothetical protein BDD43_6045 [Mucilaginibacter gracilis]|uniref:Uncharacterized protein n=1 Tax=Mucilaginibacter gracilis TaxID=423350 RepID=A0A495J9R9_9SPHI|nr:CsgG/HfaB family protein [Mucilaginibacter gracilis]RKR85770.1 hypothetical protein BDD43_6045 [Mucilaginibacter gracilis]